MVIHKAAGILIQDGKLLVEKSYDKDFYISPGGSIEEGETPKQALVRELIVKVPKSATPCLRFLMPSYA